MSTYVLIHGAWHGAWCWDKVVPLLERAGHAAVAVDLPGHGSDETPVQEVSLRAYADRVCSALDAQPGPVVLVGHSMGGIAVTQAAEYRPDKIETLVYLAAFLPRSGESVLDLAQRDEEALTGPNLIIGDDGTCTLRDDALKEIFYGDCSEADVARAKSLLVPQPLAPIVTPLSTTEENFGRVPRVYIETRLDRAVAPSAQKRMYTAQACRKVISMETSHSPFLSQPAELVAHLTSLAGQPQA